MILGLPHMVLKHRLEPVPSFLEYTLYPEITTFTLLPDVFDCERKLISPW